MPDASACQISTMLLTVGWPPSSRTRPVSVICWPRAIEPLARVRSLVPSENELGKNGPIVQYGEGVISTQRRRAVLATQNEIQRVRDQGHVAHHRSAVFEDQAIARFGVPHAVEEQVSFIQRLAGE